MIDRFEIISNGKTIASTQDLKEAISFAKKFKPCQIHDNQAPHSLTICGKCGAEFNGSMTYLPAHKCHE